MKAGVSRCEKALFRHRADQTSSVADMIFLSSHYDGDGADEWERTQLQYEHKLSQSVMMSLFHEATKINTKLFFSPFSYL